MMNPCMIPVPVEDTDGDNRWTYIHKRFVAELREKDPDVIFLGDCVLESLAFTDMWRDSFTPLHCLNLSIREDKVQNLLWRIQNGILENVKPKVCYLISNSEKPDHTTGSSGLEAATATTCMFKLGFCALQVCLSFRDLPATITRLLEVHSAS